MKSNNKLLLVLTALCSLIPALLYSQVDTAWTRRYNGPGNSVDWAHSITVDDSGNVYVTGRSAGSGTSADYATIKYNSAGVEQWSQRYNGPGNAWDVAYSIAVDGSGNVYVTGQSYGSGTEDDYATIKYNSAGVEQWIQRYNGPGNLWDVAYSIAVDGSGNVYVTGQSYGSGTDDDYATIKYNSNGVQQWVQRYNGPGNWEDRASSLAVDGQANVYVTGYSYGSGTNSDYATIKYNQYGDTAWIRRYNRPGNYWDEARSIAVDSFGNVYVAGFNYISGTDDDYATIKYDSIGVQQWVQTYNGPGNATDEAYSLAIDRLGNVYVTGRSVGSGTSADYATIKYNSAGVEQWIQRYNGPGNTADEAYSLAVDGQSNVYVTGSSYVTSFNIDYVTIRYNSAGVEQWNQRYNGLGNDMDYAHSLAIDGQANVYVTGYSYGLGTNYDYATIKYVQTQGVEEIEIARVRNGQRNDFVVYPNPAKTFFTVRSSLFASHSSLKLFDVSGKEVKSEELKGKNNRVSLDGIKNGIYFVRVGNEMIREKLVITK